MSKQGERGGDPRGNEQLQLEIFKTSEVARTASEKNDYRGVIGLKDLAVFLEEDEGLRSKKTLFRTYTNLHKT